MGVRVVCHRSHKHRLAGVIQTFANKSFTKTSPGGIGKPMPNKAVASHTHSQTGIKSYSDKAFLNILLKIQFAFDVFDDFCIELLIKF